MRHIHGKAILPVWCCWPDRVGYPGPCGGKNVHQQYRHEICADSSGFHTREWHTLPVFTKRMEHA